MSFLFFSQNKKDILKEVAGKLMRDPKINGTTKLSLLMDKLSELEDYMLTFITIPDDRADSGRSAGSASIKRKIKTTWKQFYGLLITVKDVIWPAKK